LSLLPTVEMKTYVHPFLVGPKFPLFPLSPPPSACASELAFLLFFRISVLFFFVRKLFYVHPTDDAVPRYFLGFDADLCRSRAFVWWAPISDVCFVPFLYPFLGSLPFRTRRGWLAPFFGLSCRDSSAFLWVNFWQLWQSFFLSANGLILSVLGRFSTRVAVPLQGLLLLGTFRAEASIPFPLRLFLRGTNVDRFFFLLRPCGDI